MTVYKDLKQPIGLRMEAAKAALPYEKPRLASIENKIVDEFENMSDEELEAWLDEHAEARLARRTGGVAAENSASRQCGGAAARRHRDAATDDGAGQASLIIPMGREGRKRACDRNGATTEECVTRHSGAVTRYRR
jgi:hypothetical protein